MRTLFAQIAIGCVVLIAPVTIVAAELEDAIPMDLARILFDPTGTGDFAVFTDIQSDFPSFELPAGFSVIAYLQQGNSRLLALETQYSREEAEELIMAAFLVEGWINLPLGRLLPETGFVSDVVNSTPRNSLCHDQLGRINFNFADHQGRQVFSIGKYPLFPSSDQTCAEQLARQEQSRATLNLTTGMNAHMPRLVVPDGSLPSGFSPYRYLPSLNPTTEAQTQTTLNLAWGIQETFDHFAAQLSMQGWLPDSSSVGAVSATGIWTKVSPDGMNLVGTLTAADAGEDRIEMRYLIKGTR